MSANPANRRKTRYQRRRRAAGMCGYGGCPETAADRYYCPAHQEARLVAQRVRRSSAKLVSDSRPAAIPVVVAGRTVAAPPPAPAHSNGLAWPRRGHGVF